MKVLLVSILFGSRPSRAALSAPCFLLFTVLSFAVFCVQAAPSPIRLAVVAPDPEILSAADLLTVALSQQTNVSLLERAQIDKVLREHTLEAGDAAYLKLGQILGADGLCLLETTRKDGRQLLDLRLLAVNPGVVVTEREYPWPVPGTAEWGGQVVKQFAPLFPKLRVLAKDAIPISVVSLRSSLRTPGARGREAELTQLLVHRLMREPEVFVLERSRLTEVEFEKRLKSDEESPFWTGRYLLDGILDRDGFDPRRVTVNARLVPPQGGPPVPIDLSGAANDPAGTVEALVGKVLAVFKRGPSATDWKPLAEAEQYFQEANWAHRWGLMRQAQQASESAWALGRHTRETSFLRLSSYVDEDWCRSTGRMPRSNWEYFYANDQFFPTRWHLQLARRAAELFLEDYSLVVTNIGGTDQEWLNLGRTLLDHVGGLLEVFYYVAEARSGNDTELADLRAQARQVMTILERLGPPDRGGYNCEGADDDPSQLCLSLNRLKWLDGTLWFDTPGEAVAMHRQLVESGMHPFDLPWLVGWSWEDRRRVPALLKQFVEDLSHSTNPAVRLEGLYLGLVRAPLDPEGSLEASETRLLAEMWEQRQSLFQLGSGTSLLKRTEWTLRQKYGFTGGLDMRVVAAFMQEPFASFRDRLRREYLLNAPDGSGAALPRLFPLHSSYYTEGEARTFLQLVPENQKRLGLMPPEDYFVKELVKALRERSGDTNATAEPNSVRAQTGDVSAVSNRVAEAETLSVGQFRDWRPILPGADLPMSRQVVSMRSRNGKLWAQVRYQDSIGFAVGFVVLDLETGKLEGIPLPPDLTLQKAFGYSPGQRPDFDVTQEALILGAEGHLQVYRFRDQRWTSIPVPAEQTLRVAAVRDRFYLTTPDSTVELAADLHTTRILGSARRNPPANPLDQAGGVADILAGPDESLYGVAGKLLFAFNPTNVDCQALPLFPTNMGPHRISPIISDKGIWFQLTGFGVKHRVVATWFDQPGLHCLLEQQLFPDKLMTPIPDFERLLKPADWEWPAPYFLAAATLLPDGKAAWFLHPAKVQTSQWGPGGPLVFADGRSATLLRFEPGLRQALCIPIRLEKDGQRMDPFNAAPERGIGTYRGFAFFEMGSQGLIVVNSMLNGHWLIPNAALEQRLTAHRAKIASKSSKP